MASEDSGAAYEIGHVLFVDIVGYSLKPIDQQTELLNLLQKIVRESPEFRRARDQNELISLPTGDGMALVFLRDPRSPVKCAVEIAGSLRRQPALPLRMGIHSGPVQRHEDIREGANVVGGGINTAQRVMDCGDAGHILLSSNIADMLVQFSDWRECLQDLGVQQVKHGVKLHLYSLVREPAGNAAIPTKLLARGATSRITSPDKRKTGPIRFSREQLVPRALPFAAVFVVASALTFGFERWVDRGIAESGGVAQATFTFSGLYQKIVAAPRNPIPHYTAVVEIDPDRDPGSVGLMDLCGQRKMLTTLVSRIAAARPGAIVIDKYFGERACPGNINENLIAAMTDVNSRVPVVVGRRVAPDDDYLQPSSLSGLGLREAIVNIDPDTRKLPLKWLVFPSKADKDHDSRQVWRETLALTAAQAYGKGQLEAEHPRLAKLLNPVRHPYISFLDLDQFKPYRLLAGFVLCGRQVKQGEDATACPSSSSDQGVLSGRIVVIGEITDQDVKSTVVGRIPGVFLQANFIEALLDDRYYEGYPLLNYVFGFLFLAGLEAILMVFGRSWVKTLGAIVALMIAMLFLLYIVISNFQLYVNPLPFIVLALVVRALVANVPGWQTKAPVNPVTR
jgi:CHASE2 domain-containing sensor protein/class 3 adenylate cyclase